MVTKRLYMHREYDWAVFLAILLYIHTAFVFSAIGVAWIELIRTLDISYTLLGLISVVGAGLSLVSMLVGGSLISRYGSRKTLLATIPILALSHCALALAPSQIVLIGANIGWGVGFGALLVATTTVVLDWERERRKRLIDPFQAAWNVASILGAVGAGWALTIGWNFQQILLTAAVTAFPLWLLIAFSKFPTSGIIEEPAHPFATIGIIASNRSLAILGIVVIFATFAQNVGQTWSPIYLNTIGASPLISGIALASFQAATALFRFVNGAIVKSVGTRTALLSGAFGMCIAAALLLYSQHQYVVLAAFVILGAAVAGAQPMTLAIAVRLMPTRIAVVSSGIMALGEVGFIMSTPILGWLGDTYSLQQSMATALPCGLLIMLLLFFLPKIPTHMKSPR